MTMNATSAFPFRLHWSAQALADAVPLRVHELFEPGAPSAVNQARFTPRPRPLRAGYHAPTPLPSRFRVG
jgi:ribose 1,5-bisphosphokinase PhnN